MVGRLTQAGSDRGAGALADLGAHDHHPPVEAVALATASFSACSMAMTVFNDVALRSFPLPCCLVAMQMMFTALIAATFCRRCLRAGSWGEALKWCRVVPFFAGMLITSMLALRDVPLSLILTFRSLSPFLALAVERSMPSPPRIGCGTVAALLLCSVGAILHAGDIGHGLEMMATPARRRALSIVVLSTVLACAEHLLQRLMLGKGQAPVDMSRAAATTILNAAGALPVLLAAAICGELQQVSLVAVGLSEMDWFWVLLSCVLAVGVSFTAIWVQSLITATSMLTLVNSNKFLVIFIESLAIAGAKRLSEPQVVGTTVALAASVLYVRARTAEDPASKAELEPLVKGKP